LGNVEKITFYHWKKSFYTSQSFKPLLHHLAKSKNQRHPVLKLKEKKTLCKVIKPEVIKAMVAACKYLRDKLLICLLDVHKAQIEKTKSIVLQAKQNNWQRQLEMNLTIQTNLEKIVNTLEAAHDPQA
jgi:hypothetical protein